MFLTVPHADQARLDLGEEVPLLLLAGDLDQLAGRETTMLRRPSSILRIMHWMSRSMYSAMSLGRRISTWLAGRKTLTPMSTSRLPLILRVTQPETTSSS